MSRPKLKDIFVNYDNLPAIVTGPIDVNVDVVSRLWNHTWVIIETEDDWKLIKYVQRNSDSVRIKVTIGEEQAKELIARLGLVKCTITPTFSAFSWRQPKHMIGGTHDRTKPQPR